MKSCILYMTRNTLFDIMNLNISIYLIRQIKHFDNSDIIVVSQEPNVATSHQFHHIQVDIPNFVNHNLVLQQDAPSHNHGYLHMCAWFSGLMFRESFLQKYDIITRIDTDGFLKYMVSDIPRLMYDNKVLLSSSGTFHDAKKYTIALETYAQKYCQENNMEYKLDFSSRTAFNNNFEMINFPLLMETQYMDMFDYLYNTGGIYYYRWGDSPIRYIIFKTLGLDYKVMRGIHYKHQGFRRVIGDSIM